MTKNIAVSVIVPVYNVEEFLPQCLDSILSQTLSNIEVIIVYDESKDNSLKICEDYAKRDSRIVLISLANAEGTRTGLGESRNKGIEIAKGEYLGFVDSDDYIDANYYEVLYNAAKEKNADIVETETFIFDKINEGQKWSYDLLKDITVTPDTIEMFFRNYYFASIYKHYAWDKIYSREFIVNHNIRFGDNKKIRAEDTWFQLQAVFNYPKIVFAQGTHYRYRQRLSSLVHTAERDLVQRQGLMIKMYDQLLNTDLENREVEQRACSVISVEVLTMEALNQTHFGGNAKNFIEETKKISDQPVVIKCLESLYRTKAYELEPKRGRRAFLRVIGLLFSRGMYRAARYVVWVTYRVKEHKNNNAEALYR